MSNEELREWFSREKISIDELAQMWIRLDKDEHTKTEIHTLLHNVKANRKELEGRLGQRIEFGTAGIAQVNCVKGRTPRTNASWLFANE